MSAKLKKNKGWFATISILTALLTVWIAFRPFYPPPEKAMAADWPVTLVTNYNQHINPRNLQATAQLYAGGAPIGNPVALNPNAGFDQWIGSLPDGGASPTEVVFIWDYKANAPADPDWGHMWTVNGGQAANPPQSAAANTAGTNLQVDMEDIP